MTLNERLCARAPVYGRHGMVVAGHSAATLAGVLALKRGGSIVDAMVAASAVLTVTVGQATSIGGDCFLLFHEAKSGRTIGLNASGTAPQGATPERFANGMKVHGPLAPVVPGLVRAWDVMRRRYGVLPWQSLFDDAIALAEGFPVSHSLRWCNTKTGDFLIEPSFPESIIATLAAMGHSASQQDDPYFYGSAKAIEMLPSGMLAGAGDRHREAAALGY